jgi:hypothetical protein
MVLLVLAAAHEAHGGVREGALTGLAVAGGELGGSLVGSGLGNLVGVSLPCRDREACYLAGSWVGGSVGAVSGAVLASSLVSARLDRPLLPPALAIGGTGLAIGSLLVVLGLQANGENAAFELMDMSAVVGLIAMPIAAGTAAGLGDARDASVRLAPYAGRRGSGVLMVVTPH